MLHLPPLPGSPRSRLPLGAVESRLLSDARILSEAGFDAAILENYGDVPFHKERVDAVTVAAMTRLAVAARGGAGAMRLGVNVLRNDAAAALAIAFAVDAGFIRVNVHVGATATDQGVIEGRAADTLRLRASLGANVEIWSDVHVKHGMSLAHPSIEGEAEDAVLRGLADALIVSGRATGEPASLDEVRRVKALDLGVPVYVGSGVTEENLAEVLASCDGAVVGTALKEGGRYARVDCHEVEDTRFPHHQSRGTRAIIDAAIAITLGGGGPRTFAA
jgi:membrane complex biogenesis BtpA family protein